MTKLKQHLIAALIGSVLGLGFGLMKTAKASIAPQNPLQAQRLNELYCRQNASFMASLFVKGFPPISSLQDRVADTYKPVLFFIYDHKLSPAQTYWFTYGHCVSHSVAGKANV